MTTCTVTVNYRSALGDHLDIANFQVSALAVYLGNPIVTPNVTNFNVDDGDTFDLQQGDLLHIRVTTWNTEWYVEVPAQGAIDLGDLVLNHSINPTSGLPTPLSMKDLLAQAVTSATSSAASATSSAASATSSAASATSSAATAGSARDQALASQESATDSATQTSEDRVVVAADLILTQAARDQALAAVGIIPGSAGILFHTGVAWYEAGATSPDTYQAVTASGSDAGLLVGNTGYTRQAAGVAMNPQMQSRIRRCILRNDGASVVYYLDCDDSTKIAGVWTASAQTGWVRVNEGVFDPVRPMPGQTGSGNAVLRAGLAAHDPGRSYNKGARALSAGSVWESLNDGNIGIVPAAGTTAADMTGTVGQVMVEIPRFYSLVSYDATAKRNAWEVVFDQAEVKPFPLLTDSPALPASKVVNGRVFPVHPAFAKAGVQRRARFIAAFGSSATDVGNNGTGTLQSIADGVTQNTTNVSLTNFTAKARNRNTGLSDPSGTANNVWQVADTWLYNALQIAYLTEYRTFYSQSTLGGGNQVGGDYNKIAGRSAPAGNASGSFNATGVLQTPNTGSDYDGMLYRGAEDIFGTAWRIMAGGVIKNTASGKEVYYCNEPALFVDTSVSAGYELVTSGVYVPASDNWQYATAIAEGTFLPSAAGASSGTSTTDGTYLRAAVDGSVNIFLYGGVADNGSSVGFFAALAGDTAASAYAIFGAALAR